METIEDPDSDSSKSIEISQNHVTKLIDIRNSQDNTKNLYENIGQRVLKIREANEYYEKKIIQTEEEIKLLKERVEAKRALLENSMQGHQKPKSEIKLHDAQWMSSFYSEQVSKKALKMTINKHHIDNDPLLHKAEKEKRGKLSTLQNNHNAFVKKIEEIKEDIDVLRKENNKLKANLSSIVSNKERQNTEMTKMSDEANQYLRKKGTFNEELVKVNRRIESQKAEHEAKMKELSKMIDNTKKQKQFNETLAFEKFSIKTGPNSSAHKIVEEKQKLTDLEEKLSKAKRLTVYFNFHKLLLLKKQSENNAIIDKVKKETGVDNLEQLSSDLELSKETNLKFDKDLRDLYKQKIVLERNIEKKKEEVSKAYEVLNDDHTQVEQFILQLQHDFDETKNSKEQLDKRFFALNRLIGLIAQIFKSFIDQVNVNAERIDLDSRSPEETLRHCLEFFERKMIEILQMNSDPIREGSYLEQDDSKSMTFIKKVSDNINHEEHEKLFDKKKCVQANFNLKDIKEISKDMVNSYIKKYDPYK